MALTLVSKNKCFEGWQYVYSHESVELNCKMNFSVFIPTEGEPKEDRFPVIYFLSGLTCNEQNFIQKSGFQRYAVKYNFIVVCPDTSPRGCPIEGDSESWDFGVGAGFYVDATEPKWHKHYRMYSYVTKELPDLIEKNINKADTANQSIMGHSMGGHGALICFLKNPGQYKSVSAFAPICHPTLCSWGQKAFKGYLGSNQSEWQKYDATHLVKSYSGTKVEILIDQGKEDQFLEVELQPHKFAEACKEASFPLNLRIQEGYDHGYYFISSFVGDHFNHHFKIIHKKF